MMTTNQQWLDRLDQATDYQQLQTIFAELSSQAETTSERGNLAASMDEAIRRIEHERARDQLELHSHQERYAAFKTQQSGVVGWFKRHLPFTETRRQDRQHRATVSDQQAEILADNLIIARAQILKQRLLPPDARLLGLFPDQWQGRLLAAETVERIAEFGQVIAELSQELTRSEQFVDELRRDINAFAQAEFASQEDQLRQREDLKASRDELQTLLVEIEDEKKLCDTAVSRAGELVSEELRRNDPAFRSLLEQLEQWRQARQLAKAAGGGAIGLSEAFAQLHTLSEQAQQAITEQQDLTLRSSRLQSDLEKAAARHEQTRQRLSEATADRDAAQGRLDQANASYQAAERMVAMHQTMGAEATAQASQNPLMLELQRLGGERSQAETSLRAAHDPYLAAEASHTEAQAAIDKIESKLHKLQRQQHKLEVNQQRIDTRLDELNNDAPKLLSEFEDLLNEYLAFVKSLEWDSQAAQLNRSLQWQESLERPIGSNQQSPAAWRTPRPLTTQEMQQRFQIMVDAIEQDRRYCRQQTSRLEKEWQQLWQARCLELLGPITSPLVGIPRSQSL